MVVVVVVVAMVVVVVVVVPSDNMVAPSAGCTAGQLCQFLGPPPAAFTKPVPLPLLSPLLALINGAPQALSSTTSTTSTTTSAVAVTNLSLAASSSVPLITSTASTATLPSTNTPLTISSSLPASLSSMPSSNGGGGTTTAAGITAVLDSRSVMDIRNVAASCGFSSRVLADMIRPDGRGLQRHADPRVIERVGLHMVNQGFTTAQVYRFLLPNGGCEYGQLDPPTAAAVRAVLLAAGFSIADLKTLLTNNGTTITTTASAATLAAVAYTLAASGATADQIRHLLRPPPGAVPAPPPQSPKSGGGGGSSPAAAAAAAADSVSSLAVAILKGLMSAGYEDHQLDLILRKDGTALRADVGPLRLAQMVAALAAAEIPAATIRLFVRPLGGVQPAVALSLRAALEQCPGFDSERVQAAFSPELYELGPSVEPSTLADIANALSTAGVSADVIRQLLSLPPGLGSGFGPGTNISNLLTVASAAATAAAGGGEAATAAPAAAPAAEGSVAAAPSPGGYVTALRGCLFAARWAESLPNPADLMDMHDPAKVVVALADGGYPSEEIRAFVGTDPKLLTSPAFLRASGPMPPPGTAAGSTAAGAAGAGGSGSGFVAAVLARGGGGGGVVNGSLGVGVVGGGMSSAMRMSDPGFSRNVNKLRQNANHRLALLSNAVPGSGSGASPVRFTTDGAPPRIPEQPTAAPPAFPDFEYRLGGGGEGTASAAAAGVEPAVALSVMVVPLTAEQLLAWMAGVRQLVPMALPPAVAGVEVEVEVAGVEAPSQPQLPTVEHSTLTSTNTPRATNNDPFLRRSLDPGYLRALPAGYARAWGDTSYSRTGSGSLLEGRTPAPLVYRSLPHRANPSATAAKAGSPRETLPPWPLQRAFVHPHPASPSSMSYTAAAAAAPLTSYGRLVVELPGSPSGAPSSPGQYGFRSAAAATATGAVGAVGGGGGGGGAAPGTASSSSLPGLSPNGPVRSMAVSGDGSGRGFSQPPSPSRHSANSGAVHVGPSTPRRPSSSGTIVTAAGGGGRSGGGGGGGGEAESLGTRLPALRRTASTDKLGVAVSSPVASRTTPETSPTGAVATAAPLSPEALFVRLLAELLRWLEAPLADDTSSSSFWTSDGFGTFRKGCTTAAAGSGGGGGGVGGSGGCGGGWQSWLAAQKVRLATQFAQLETTVAAAAQQQQEPGKGGGGGGGPVRIA
ncbi:hypothetical protein VOLCADRAFT_92557 [Volvox carteri f. nagariensis]|uniref:Uncharacterized protein n=1 Tax=Volvox carteri f. nagariensis TaxID=3068 RepID=D8TZZ3_VOLCA|nr:uncharacterized protein VOLCADRAFT_92557 [Volvox carteri f. nagariensis]EFJ47017.1 hypothetical protein VOLCADRAFT_92557 [Volvox carteri f. nagariensis]|eukprot:XP_002951912.1 hypothetical protein VOLCADRAFT_92557 [Volvox carteri f. nagariensis]